MYDKISIEEMCVKAIEEHGLTFFSELTLYVEPAESTLYLWELDKSESIKNALSKNKLASKRKMRAKWQGSDNPALQIAAYKLLATDDELDKLTSNKVDAKLNHSGGVTVISRPANYETK